MQRNIIRQYYILSGLFTIGGLSIISAICSTFLIKNGLSLFEVNLVNAAYYLTIFLCEIPTGAFADIFGRKTSFVSACGFMCLSMFIYGSSHTFTGFVCAEIVAAIGFTFRSGAFKAWLVDSLKHHGYEGGYTKIFGRGNLICQIGGGIGAVAGSYIAVRNPTLPWFIGGTIMALTTAIAYFTMEEHYFVKGVFSWKRGWSAMRNVIASSVKYGTQHKTVRFILTITCVQIFAVQALNMYWQPFFKNHGVSEQHFGFLFTGMMISLAVGAFLVSRLKNTGNEKRIILKSQICTGLCIILATIIPGLPCIVILFLLHEVPRGYWGPMIDDYLHQRIPSHERATIASFCSIAPHICGAIGLLVSGIVAQCFGISVAWIVSGIVLIAGALIVAKNGNEGSD